MYQNENSESDHLQTYQNEENSNAIYVNGHLMDYKTTTKPVVRGLRHTNFKAKTERVIRKKSAKPEQRETSNDDYGPYNKLENKKFWVILLGFVVVVALVFILAALSKMEQSEGDAAIVKNIDTEQTVSSTPQITINPDSIYPSKNLESYPGHVWLIQSQSGQNLTLFWTNSEKCQEMKLAISKTGPKMKIEVKDGECDIKTGDYGQVFEG